MIEFKGRYQRKVSKKVSIKAALAKILSEKYCVWKLKKDFD